mmetsp:Transcript_36944/g.64716  ORF Transcript_36944/g.64716 Transcript_36944/m.64716 type:complete len:692 (+) Transcript_36944:168-2243(+)|eukprot:CAMPEP_0201874028 /NCGR_PEP_ID=MMETSP0902-20130614/6391_1 /ASSEMBLY_ACC=CAM_ASM_000551 /TAXON_ID=420261 /ORGANISM="Thalassiosira antarctica, Strain CCMP982" /LENGTH=691 /DNA_ID=CAMNT_0048400797 /DNA_START=122 /DNA_END=2197 /DNA_ORIENTATION=+
MDTVKLIIALIALRFDRAWGFNGSITLRTLPSSSPLRVAWATSNDDLAQNFATNEQGEGRQKAKAPLVDSALLRFLSSQKKSGAVLLKDENGQASAGNATPLDSPNVASRGMEVDFPTFVSENLVEGEIEAPSTASSAIDLPSDKPIESQSWLSQYNAQRVALKLQALGVDSDAAIKSGKIVQDYVLARVTRRRIRKFLHERDALWESGYPMPLGRKGIKESISPAAASSFDIDGVIAVMSEYGLTGNDVAAVFSHTPSVAMMRARTTGNEVQIEDTNGKRKSFALEETLDRAFVGLLSDTLKLRRYDARKVLRASPGLLTTNGSVSAVQVVNLMVSLGSSTNSLARDKTSLPTLLCRSPALIFRLVAFLSSAQLKVPLSAIGPILRQKQSAALLNAVAPIKHTITLDAYDDIASKNLTSLNTESEILGYFKADNTMRQQKIEESYRTIEDVAGVLRRSAGIRDFRTILSSHPDAFFLNVTNIDLMTHYLREDVGMTKDDIAKAIQTFPILLEQDVSRVEDVVEFLLAMEVDEDDLPSILRSFPATLLLDTEKDMIPVVSFLRDIGVRNIGRFVTRLPPVLGYSLEDDLKPKWDFLKEVCQFDYFEVVRFPAYFSYPLERVIKMRYEYLRDIKQIPIELARVDDVLRFGDRDFSNEIALDDDDGAAFSKFVEDRSGALHPSIRSRRKQRNR